MMMVIIFRLPYFVENNSNMLYNWNNKFLGGMICYLSIKDFMGVTVYVI